MPLISILKFQAMRKFHQSNRIEDYQFRAHYASNTATNPQNSAKINLIYSQLKIPLIDKMLSLRAPLFILALSSISIVFSNRVPCAIYESFIFLAHNNPASKYRTTMATAHAKHFQ